MMESVTKKNMNQSVLACMCARRLHQSWVPLNLMNLIWRAYSFDKNVTQNSVPYDVLKTHCITLGKKMDKAKVHYLIKNKFQAYNKNFRSKQTSSIPG